MPLRRSNLIALAAAGIGLLAMAASRPQPSTSDASTVMSWLRWAHETTNTGRGVVERLMGVWSHAENAAGVVSTMLATAERDARHTPECDPAIAPTHDWPSAVPIVRLASVPMPTPVRPVAPQATMWSRFGDVAVIREVSCVWSDAAWSAKDAERLPHEARRVVWFKM
ncbi:MAG TPA: hypothetical protein VF777_14645 [Phycisphaerales bacterium]